MSRIFDILLIMLLNPDTARISVQKLHPVNHREYFLNRQVNLLDQLHRRIRIIKHKKVILVMIPMI